MWQQIWIVASLSTLVVAGATAQTLDENGARCRNSPLSIDLRIANCTAAIQSGQETKDNLARDYQSRGILYDYRKDYEREIADLSETIRLQPTNPPSLYPLALLQRGDAYHHAGDNDHAIQDSSQMLKLNVMVWFALTSRGLDYAAKGDNDRAIKDYDEAIRLDPHRSEPGVFSHRGDAYRAKGDNDHAIQDYNQALRRFPGNMCALYGRGLAYQNNGDDKRAKLDFDELERVYAITNLTKSPILLPRPPESCDQRGS